MNHCPTCQKPCAGHFCDRCADLYDLRSKAIELLQLGYYLRPRLIAEWHGCPSPLQYWIDRGLTGWEVLRLYPYLPDRETWERRVHIRGVRGPVWYVWRVAPYLVPADITHALWGTPEKPWGPVPRLWERTHPR